MSIKCEKYTVNEWIARVKDHAEQAFAQHSLIQETEDRWFVCRTDPVEDKPEDFFYSFRVVRGPSLIFLYGDVGEFCLLPYDNDSLSWLRNVLDGENIDISYIMQKAAQEFRTHVFLLKEAYACCDTFEKESDDVESLKTFKEFKTRFDENVACGSSCFDVCAEYAAWIYACDEVYQDFELYDLPLYWSYSSLFSIFALQKFLQLLNLKEKKDRNQKVK